MIPAGKYKGENLYIITEDEIFSLPRDYIALIPNVTLPLDGMKEEVKIYFTPRSVERDRARLIEPFLFAMYRSPMVAVMAGIEYDWRMDEN
jgi:hypothetical protein